jgi:hypothetical protein
LSSGWTPSNTFFLGLSTCTPGPTDVDTHINAYVIDVNVSLGEARFTERFHQMVSRPATQVQIPRALWRRIEILFVFRDDSGKSPRIQPVRVGCTYCEPFT